MHGSTDHEISQQDSLADSIEPLVLDQVGIPAELQSKPYIVCGKNIFRCAKTTASTRLNNF
jgi:hypothetical protein